MYYICIITSVDWYTFYDGYEVVKASSPAQAKEKAIKQWTKKNPNDADSFGKYRFIETIIKCGTVRPKE